MSTENKNSSCCILLFLILSQKYRKNPVPMLCKNFDGQIYSFESLKLTKFSLRSDYVWMLKHIEIIQQKRYDHKSMKLN